jgi:protease-4
VYDQFIAAVADRRRLEAKDVRGFAEGRIYSGRQAQGLKMVDDLGGLEDAIEAAAQMAGLPPKPKVVYPRRRFSLRDLLRSELGLGQVSRMLPALETLRTPLYLMP